MTINPHVLILFTGLFYILIFGGLSLLRREGLSTQFAIEVLLLTLLSEAIALAIGTTIDPLVFLAFIYLVSMRGRLLTDLANLLSSRGRQKNAIKILQWALQLYPDRSTRLVIEVNMGIVQLRRKNPASAQEILVNVLRDMDAGGGLGIKYEAACRYNLGQAYMQQEKLAKAIEQFNETMVIFPSSIYSRSADRILEQLRSQRKEPAEGTSKKDETIDKIS
ncbi:MAG: hypothetical protein JXA42_16520 [Anaerolineales bacterium]|nr:hypothetical protein [Anaerolineales bacterium]